jgi:hypothetical protein
VRFNLKDKAEIVEGEVYTLYYDFLVLVNRNATSTIRSDIRIISTSSIKTESIQVFIFFMICDQCFICIWLMNTSELVNMRQT